MPKPYRIGRHRGQCVLVFRDTQGHRHRVALGTSDKSQAELVAPSIYAELIRPRTTLVRDLWVAYNQDKPNRAILRPRQFAWKAVEPYFGDLRAEDITVQLCR